MVDPVSGRDTRRPYAFIFGSERVLEYVLTEQVRHASHIIEEEIIVPNIIQIKVYSPAAFAL